MSKLNWEKQNKAELPKEQKKRNYQNKIFAAYENGTTRECDRIVKAIEGLWEEMLDVAGDNKSVGTRAYLLALQHVLDRIGRGRR